MNYVVVIPAKNEEINIRSCLNCLFKQSIAPRLILVVDNDSDDTTLDQIKTLKLEHSNLDYIIHKDDLGYELGGKIVKLFEEGKEYIDKKGVAYDFIVKMDADIRFNENVFRSIFNEIDQKKDGIISPLPFSCESEKKIYSSTPDWHTNGDLKIYNKKCYKDIGGLQQDLGWDCADNIMALEKGYATKVLKEVSYKQTRPIGRYSKLRGLKRQGIGAHKLRYSYTYLIIKFLHDLLKPPYIIGSICYLYGFISAKIKLEKQILNKDQGKILRKLFWKSAFERLKTGRFYFLQKFSKE